SRRISARPSFSSCPPMMTRFPLAVTGVPPARRLGSCLGSGGTPRCERWVPRPLPSRARPFRPLVLLAIELDPSFAVLQEILRHPDLTLADHSLPARNDFHR